MHEVVYCELFSKATTYTRLDLEQQHYYAYRPSSQLAFSHFYRRQYERDYNQYYPKRCY